LVSGIIDLATKVAYLFLDQGETEHKGCGGVFGKSRKHFVNVRQQMNYTDGVCVYHLITKTFSL
jgi:hypothetical protein